MCAHSRFFMTACWRKGSMCCSCMHVEEEWGPTAPEKTSHPGVWMPRRLPPLQRAQCNAGFKTSELLAHSALILCAWVGRPSAVPSQVGTAKQFALEEEWDYWWMKPASWVVTKKGIGRKCIIQVGLTQVCGLGKFPGYPARYGASERCKARMCVMT